MRKKTPNAFFISILHSFSIISTRWKDFHGFYSTTGFDYEKEEFCNPAETQTCDEDITENGRGFEVEDKDPENSEDTVPADNEDEVTGEEDQEHTETQVNTFKTHNTGVVPLWQR